METMLDLLTALDKENPTPRHLQVQKVLRDLLISGHLRPGDRIASEVEIADVLGVSRMTVNKAIVSLTSDGFFVREVGRGTFVARGAAEKSGDNLPLVATETRNRTETLRIILSFVSGARDVLESDYYSTLYRGVLDAVSEEKEFAVDLVLSPLAAGDYLAEEVRAPSDGRLIVSPRADSIPSLQTLWDRGKALVVLGASWPQMSVPTIDSDNVSGTAEAITYLAQNGHRRIALLYAEEESSNIRDRIRGYRQALRQNGLSVFEGGEVCAAAAWKAGETAFAQLVSLLAPQTPQSEPVTAIFAAGFYLALEAMNAARMAGLRVPEDVSVIGYDDPLSAHLVYPPLTTIRQPLREMGRRAAERLLYTIRTERQKASGFAAPDTRGRVVQELLSSHLIVRGSVAPAPPGSREKTISGEAALSTSRQ